jgi:hypothetical protein
VLQEARDPKKAVENGGIHEKPVSVFSACQTAARGSDERIHQSKEKRRRRRLGVRLRLLSERGTGVSVSGD